MSLYRRTSNFALQLHERFAVKIPELNASPVIWKCVRSLGGSRESCFFTSPRSISIFSASSRFPSPSCLRRVSLTSLASSFLPSRHLPCRHLPLPIGPTPPLSSSRSRSQSRSQSSERSSRARRSDSSSKRRLGRRSSSTGAGDHGCGSYCVEDGVWAGWKREVSLIINSQSANKRRLRTDASTSASLFSLRSSQTSGERRGCGDGSYG